MLVVSAILAIATIVIGLLCERARRRHQQRLLDAALARLEEAHERRLLVREQLAQHIAKRAIEHARETMK